MLNEIFFPIVVNRRIKCNNSQQGRILRSLIHFLTGQGGTRPCEIPEAPLLPSTAKFQFDTILTGDGEPADGNTEHRLLCKMQPLMEG